MILLGAPGLTPGGSAVTLPTPSGFNSVKAIRVANGTEDVVTLTNINGVDQSQEYLMPLTQMVYRMANVTLTPTAVGGVLTPAELQAGLFIEFGTDPDNDFPGTYPYSMLTEPAS